MKRLLLMLFLVVAATASAQYTYVGQKNSKGLPEGEGVMKWSNARFEGTFHKGEPVKGTLTKYNSNGKRESVEIGTFTTRSHKKGFLNPNDVLGNGFVEKTVFGTEGLISKMNYKNGLAEGAGEVLFFKTNAEGYRNDMTSVIRGTWQNDYLVGSRMKVTRIGVRRYSGLEPTSPFPKHDSESRALWNKWLPYYKSAFLSDFEYTIDDMKNTGWAMVFYNYTFKELNNVRWSGNVSNGKLQGEGLAYAELNDGDRALFIRGRFNNGVMVGSARVSVTGENATNKLDYNITIGEKNNGYASCSVENEKGKNTYYGVVDKSGNVVVPIIYKNIITPFNAGGYAVVLNYKDEEIKVGYDGVERGFSERQEQINAEAKRKAEFAEHVRLAEEARKAEEARLEALRKNEEDRYNRLKKYCNTFCDDQFDTAYTAYIAKFPKGLHLNQINDMRKEVLSRSARIDAGKSFSKWRLGTQVCVIYNNDVLLGVVEQFNEDRSAVQVKITAATKDYNSYKGQDIVKGGTIWVQRSWGWHIALDEELDYASSRNKLMTDNERVEAGKCSSCGGKGFIICRHCDGKGKIYDSRSGYDKTCSRCKGNGQYMCYSCDGKGKR